MLSEEPKGRPGNGRLELAQPLIRCVRNRSTASSLLNCSTLDRLNICRQDCAPISPFRLAWSAHKFILSALPTRWPASSDKEFLRVSCVLEPLCRRLPSLNRWGFHETPCARRCAFSRSKAC